MGILVTAFTGPDYYVDQGRQAQLFLYCNQVLRCKTQAMNVDGKPVLFVDVECPLIIEEIKKLKDIKIIVDKKIEL